MPARLAGEGWTTRLVDAVRALWAARATRRAVLQGTCSLALVLGVGWFIVMRGAAGEADASADALRAGQSAPDFTVETLTALPFTLSAVRGQPVWISFWGSWCPPCRAELPDIEVVRVGAGDRLKFIAVDMDESRADVAAYMSSKNYDFPVGLDPTGEVSNRYRVVGLPTHVFVAADGTVAEIRVGGMSRSEMSAAVDALLMGGRSKADRPNLGGGTAEERLGAAIYNGQCLRCHGGRDGTGGIAGAPPHTDEGHTWHHSDLRLTAVIMRGGGNRQAMPAFGDRLSAEEVRAVLAYLKTWWGEEQREFQARMTKENDRGRD